MSLERKSLSSVTRSAQTPVCPAQPARLSAVLELSSLTTPSTMPLTWITAPVAASASGPVHRMLLPKSISPKKALTSAFFVQSIIKSREWKGHLSTPLWLLHEKGRRMENTTSSHPCHLRTLASTLALNFALGSAGEQPLPNSGLTLSA